MTDSSDTVNDSSDIERAKRAKRASKRLLDAAWEKLCEERQARRSSAPPKNARMPKHVGLDGVTYGSSEGKQAADNTYRWNRVHGKPY